MASKDKQALQRYRVQKAKGWQDYASKVTSEDVLKYLTDRRAEIIRKLVVQRQIDKDMLKPCLKQAIYKYLEEKTEDYCKRQQKVSSGYAISLEANKYIARVWQYKPCYLKEEEYINLVDSKKIPLHTKDYTFFPYFKFKNNVSLPEQTGKKAKAKIYSDAQFFVSEYGSDFFTKLITLRYLPTEKEDHLNASNYRYCSPNYERNLSASLCVMINGDPNRNLPIIRYDNSPNPHQNSFIGDDPRKYVFGELVQSPHIHFQNEEDSLLCLRTAFDKETSTYKYKNGNCSAIDLPHLREYLIYLDRLTDAEALKMLKSGEHYGMPFLKMRAGRSEYKSNVFAKARQYINTLSYEGQSRRMLEEWLSKSNQHQIYGRRAKYNGNFSQLIKVIDFLMYIAKQENKSEDPKTRFEFSQIEVLLVNSFLCSISNIKENYQQESYQIETIEEEKDLQ